MKTLQKLWWFTLLRGIILVLLAFFVFRHPVNALMGVAIYIGISLLITGILQTGASLVLKIYFPIGDGYWPEVYLILYSVLCSYQTRHLQQPHYLLL